MKKILIVDDDLDVRQALKKLLSKYKPLLARSSREAEMIFARDKDILGVILLDGYLHRNDPQVNTLALTRLIRASGFTRPIVAMSSDASFRAKQVEAGCSHNIYKDNHEEILALVERELA